jgi:hypothetical protein
LGGECILERLAYLEFKWVYRVKGEGGSYLLNDANGCRGRGGGWSTPNTWSSNSSSQYGESSTSSSHVKTLSLSIEERVRMFVMGAKSTDIGSLREHDPSSHHFPYSSPLY